MTKVKPPCKPDAPLGIFFHALAPGRDVKTARTLVVNMLAVLEIFYLFNVRYVHMTSTIPLRDGLEEAQA